MSQRYAEWIETYVARQPNRFVRGKCSDATKEMVAAFPELRRVCGFVRAPWGDDQHWWCIAPDGSVVDPTREQFPAVFGYEEVDLANPHRPIPTGRCADCGEPTFNGESFCGSACEAATVAYLNGFRS